MHDKAFHENNFNLIRLLAALQVAHYHLVSIYAHDVTEAHHLLVKVLGLFPGVPIFFFISGFLISRSWERSSSWKSYLVKRAARIEPALIASVIFAFTLTWASGYFSTRNDFTFVDILLVALAKITFLQFYNPDFLRDYGDGVLNGSLWTITVELQFYLIIPFIFILFLKKNASTRIIILTLVFLTINVLYDFLHGTLSENIFYKLFHVSFMPWFFMFLAGVFFQKNFDFFYGKLRGKFLYILAIYLAIGFFTRNLPVDYGNSLNPLVFAILCCLIFSAAYSPVKLSDKTIGHTDISYGTYLYHMPIINFFLYMGFPRTYPASLTILFLIIITSLISWFLIEKPALNYFKK